MKFLFDRTERKINFDDLTVATTVYLKGDCAQR